MRRGKVTNIDASSTGWDAQQIWVLSQSVDLSIRWKGFNPGKFFIFEFLRRTQQVKFGQRFQLFQLVISLGKIVEAGEMLLWFDASDIDADGDPSNEPFGGRVDFWRDKSGNSRNAGTEMVPVCRSTVERSDNPKFDGNGQYLRVEDSDVLISEKKEQFLLLPRT